MNRYSPHIDREEDSAAMSIDAGGSWVHITAYEQLRAALRRYGSHEASCTWRRSRCSCGFTEMVAGPPAEPKPGHRWVAGHWAKVR